MIRVEELVTGEQLRALSGMFHTQDLGNGIFRVTYWEDVDEPHALHEEESQIPRLYRQYMNESDAVERLMFASALGMKIVSARRSNIELEDGQPLYEVKWTIVNQEHEVDPEDLNTGPDTTENINEVVEQAPEKEQDPETERISKAVERMKWRSRNNFRDMDTAETTERDRPKWKFVTPDKETLEELVDEARKRGCTFTGTPESDEKIRAAMSGWSEKKNTDFPGAKQGEERLEKQQEGQVRDGGDVMFGVDLETQGLQGNVDPLMSREFLERYREPIVLGPNPVVTPGAETIDDLTEEERLNLECGWYSPKRGNKNVSQDEDKKDPGDYYRYSNILKRMDDTHTRKNNDYGDAAYQGYKKFGDYYFMVQLHNKYQRLESLTIGNKSQQVEDESIDDTLLDMANYAVMYLESRHRND